LKAVLIRKIFIKIYIFLRIICCVKSKSNPHQNATIHLYERQNMADFSSQWSYVLKHVGIWEGSFTRLSPLNEWIEDTPTCVTLEGIDHNRAIRQTIQRFSSVTRDQRDETQRKVLEYSSLNRSTLFFENGAFSQGSIQYSPVSEFGAEFGFIQGDRRLRIVILYDRLPGSEGHLTGMTLIREHRRGSHTPERPHLVLENLIGTWQGTAITQYAEIRPPSISNTHLMLRLEGDRLHQHLTSDGVNICSTATLDGARLLFDQGSVTNQVTLLPDGASYTAPLLIPRGSPFFLEAGWLVTNHNRQRLIRSYDAKGAWVGLTWVEERKG
jgi:hypothetical protein